MTFLVGYAKALSSTCGSHNDITEESVGDEDKELVNICLHI